MDEDHHRLRMTATGAMVLPRHAAVSFDSAAGRMATSISLGDVTAVDAVIDTGELVTRAFY